MFAADDAASLARYVPEPVAFVLLANTFHGVPDKTGLARTVSEVLAAGGRFAVVNWHPIPREQTRVLGQPRGPATELRYSLEQTRASVQAGGVCVGGGGRPSSLPLRGGVHPTRLEIVWRTPENTSCTQSHGQDTGA